MSYVAAVNAQLELSRKKLLDISMRNPLLNYRAMKSRGLEFIEVDSSVTFRQLTSEGKKIPLVATGKEKGADEDDTQSVSHPLEGETEAEYETIEQALARLERDVGRTQSTALLREDETVTPSASRSRENAAVLKTAYAPSVLLKRLLETYYAYNVFIEEQGVNALFLTLGMLTWYEADSHEQGRRAPLILIPVELERVTATQYRLTYTGDDVRVNDCLASLLQTDFGVKLPELPHTENEGSHVEDINVLAYFASVQKAIENNKRWEVEEDFSALAFFSFSKMRMYYDLDEKNWPEGQKPGHHGLITSLLVTGFNEGTPRFSENDYLDEKLVLSDCRTVMDSDSSQVLAVEEVKQGRNLVIQGPPGTGKSQTITNIIAEALGQGKKVLFVAEKMAALVVVKQRLDSLGLGGACLELHSNKTNKKAVLAELQNTLALGKPVQGNVTQDIALLTAAQGRLNRYAQIVNSAVGKSGLTLYQVYGEWLRCESEMRFLFHATPGAETAADKTEVVLPRLDVSDFLQRDALNIRQCEQLIQEAQAQVALMGVPVKHPFWGSKCAVFLPADAEDLRRDTATALSEVRDFTQRSEALAEKLHLTTPETPASAEALARAVQRANAAPPFVGVQIGMTEWLAYRPKLETLIQKGKRLSGVRQQYADALVPEAWEAETNALLEMRQVIATRGGSWLRIFSGEWRSSQKRVALLCADGKPPKDQKRQAELLEALLEYRRIQKEFREEEPRGQALFGAQWQGEGSDWNVLDYLLTWIAELHEEVGGGKVPKAFLDFLVAAPDLKPLNDAAEGVLRSQASARSALQQCLRRLEITESGVPLFEQSLSLQERRIISWATNTERVSEIIAFNSLGERLIKERLPEAFEAATTWGEAGRGLLLAFRRSYLEALLRFAYQQCPELAAFNGAAHEATLIQFRDLDKRHLQHNRNLLAEKHWTNLPSMQGEGQIRTLNREFQKKSRHLALRQLMDKAGLVIQDIKPIFMMSPLSVATYLPPGQVVFDLIIFDEASQVEPVDALGALLRGKQAVVVGDSKQLPPTSFFSKMEDAEAEENATSDLESVLNLFLNKGAPERMLKWHYRSRHESLIAVSNQEFYNNSLVLFPSPDAARQELGLFYHYLPETVYDSGGTAANRLEAKAVAEAVLRHAQLQLQKPQKARLTLGVAAFSTSQMQAITAQLEMLRRQNPDCEPFFQTGGNESFFVKNLENVQGDERDIIYISIGYGKDKNGKIAMNFGPLNRDGGQRRLNVLITRARLRCEVFTNLTPDDIDLSRSSATGVAAFKQFLTYAKTGNFAASTPSGKEFDSPFEPEVISVIRSLGYEATPQIGCVGYFVDIGVKDPELPGRFLLGVECDGAMYHSARSARDRDRLREEVLVRMGWQIHRIWSTDWFNRREAETKRLAAVIEKAIQAAHQKAEQKLETAASSITASSSEAANMTAESVQMHSFVREEASHAIVTLPDYVCAQLPLVYGSIYDTSPYQLAAMVLEVVTVESPVALSEVVRRIGEAFQAGRITEKFRASAMRGLSLALGEKKVVERGAFMWSPLMHTTPLRSRATLESRARQVELIAPEEIRRAIEQAVKTAYSLPFDDLARSAGRLFGIERLTADAKTHIDNVAEALIQGNLLKRLDGQVSLIK